MNTEEKKVVRVDENADMDQVSNRSRRAFAKVGVIAPAIMTLTSKSALGGIYQCTISGMQSGNTSSHVNTKPDCGVGFSPGGWWQNASKPSNGNDCSPGPAGNISHWCKAGVNPFKIAYRKISGNGTNAVYAYKYDQYNTGTWTTPDTTTNVGKNWVAVCEKIRLTTNWPAALKTTVTIGLDTWNVVKASTLGDIGLITGSSKGVWLQLDTDHGSGSGPEWHAIADYLNAKLYLACPNITNTKGLKFSTVYQDVSPAEVILIYKLAKSGTKFESDSGLWITNPQDASKFLEMIHE